VPSNQLDSRGRIGSIPISTAEQPNECKARREHNPRLLPDTMSAPSGKPPPGKPAPGKPPPGKPPPPSGGNSSGAAEASGRTSPAPPTDDAKLVNTSGVPSIRTSDEFDRIAQVGEGTYGSVYKAKDRLTNEMVAMKKIRMGNEKEGFPITAIREIKLLRELDHENVVKLKEVVSSKETCYNRGKGSVYIVFEFMDHDLMGLMDTVDMQFAENQIKCFVKQLLTGLHYCHKRNIMHRDIKGSNLLINNAGVLKLGDFGLSRSFNEKDINYRYTNRVVTLWYRPPELLLGAVVYGPAIDVWGVGCIMAELLMRKPLFPGKNERDQMDRVFAVCGTPHAEIWPSCTELTFYNTVQRPEKERKPDRLKQHLLSALDDRGNPRLNDNAVDLVRKMLVLDPAKRISAADSLDHDWFWSDPMPCDPASLPRYPSSHEFVTKKRRQDAKQSNNPQPDAKRHQPDRQGQQPQGGTHSNGHRNAGAPRGEGDGGTDRYSGQKQAYPGHNHDRSQSMNGGGAHRHGR